MSSRAAAPPLLEARVGPARTWCSRRVHGNVGDHVGDDPVVVAANRSALAVAVEDADAAAWVWVRQVHGAAVHVVSANRGTEGGRGVGLSGPPEADAIVTAVRGLPIAIVTADCAPLVVASADAVGVVHAGYRGLASGVIETAVAEVRALGSDEVHAFLGPCIRAARYEFGADDLATLVAQFGPGVEARTAEGRPALDIPAGIRVVLDRIGVATFDDCGICTSASAEYFSYRRDGDTGRQATFAVLP